MGTNRRVTWTRLGQLCAGTVGGLAVAGMIAATPAHSKPCEQHTGKAKAACITQAKRDAMRWPPRPSNAEVIKRIGIDQWRKAERVAYCETGGNVNHYPHGTYIGLMGMYVGTYGIGVEGTKGPGNRRGYRWVSEGATKAEQIAIAWEVVKRYGWSAWSCGGA
jgi:hypothetical protein